MKSCRSPSTLARAVLLIAAACGLVVSRPVAARAQATAEKIDAAVGSLLLRLTVPPHIYAVEGQELRVYFDNLVLSPEPDAFRVSIKTICDSAAREAGAAAVERASRHEARRWVFTPTKDCVGTHTLLVSVGDADGKPLATRLTQLHVAPADAGADREIALLIVGDSLTNATHYPNEWARLLSAPGNPQWTMLGTHRPGNAQEGVAHEGYGGWKWETFATRYEVKPDPAKRIRSSPFVFALEEGGSQTKAKLDVARYIQEHCNGRKPDVVTFLLGINDCFAAPPDDRAALDAHINAVFKHADTLLAEFRRAAPKADLAVCLTTPPNAREEGFIASYKGRYSRWNWKRIQHRLVERELAHFGGREAERIFLVPTELDLDPIDGYPPDNGVHPNKEGYAQIAASLHAWLKNRMTTTSAQ